MTEQVFYTEVIHRNQYDTRLASGKPLAGFTRVTQDAYEAAGRPDGDLMVRHRIARDYTPEGVNDGIRSSASSGQTFLAEFYVVK